MLKVAAVAPIFKSGDKDSFTDHRPISLLPIFSEILKRLIHPHLSDYQVENNILCSLQFGVR